MYWPSCLLGSCRILGPTRLGIPPSLAPEVGWDLSLVDICTRRRMGSLHPFPAISRMREVAVNLLEYPKENTKQILASSMALRCPDLFDANRAGLLSETPRVVVRSSPKSRSSRSHSKAFTVDIRVLSLPSATILCRFNSRRRRGHSLATHVSFRTYGQRSPHRTYQSRYHPAYPRRTIRLLSLMPPSAYKYREG